MPSRSLVLWLALPGCATFGRPMGEVVIPVETQEPIGRLEFIDADSGEPLEISAVPAGSALFKDTVKVGRYCLRRYVVGQGAYGKLYEHDGEICLSVTEGKRAYRGHFVVSSNGRLEVRVDWQCLDNQLNEQSALGNVNVTPCATP